MALKLPIDHPLNQFAARVIEQVRRKCTLSLESHLKEELTVYNPSTFGQDYQQANYTQLAITLADLYELCQLAGCPQVLIQEYTESKMSLISKRFEGGSSRDLSSILDFAANLLWRELQIYQRSADQSEDDSMQSFIGQAMRATVFQVDTWWQCNDHKKLNDTIKEFELKKTIWESSYQRLLLLVDQAKLRSVLPASEWNQVAASLLTMPYAIADAVCMQSEDRYQAALTEKSKATDLEEKLKAVDFEAYFRLIEDNLRLSVDVGCSLRSINWISSTEKFLAAISKKLNECMRVIEKYYFEESLELRDDPFLQLNFPLFHKLYARDSPVSEILAHIEMVSLPYDKFNITKKLSVSLLEVLITKHGDYLSFLRKVGALIASLDDRLTSSGQLAHVIRELQGEQTHIRKLNLPKDHLKEFRDLVLRLIVKDLRVDACKYAANSAKGGAGNNQVLMAVDQHFTQAAYKIDQICDSEQSARRVDYAFKRIDEYGGYRGGPDDAGRFVNASLAEDHQLPGNLYWKELIVCSLFMFILTFLKSEGDLIDIQKVDCDIGMLRKGFRRSLKYRVN